MRPFLSSITLTPLTANAPSSAKLPIAFTAVSVFNRFNLTSDEYNHLAELALGIAEQESKFGTSDRYKAKSLIPDWMMDTAKYISRGNSGARSRGYTQIKIDDIDNLGAAKIRIRSLFSAANLFDLDNN